MALSPMMQEYKKVKEEYPDCVLMYRVGDFYEMFFEDALRVSKLLELTLTGKECGLPERAPMCGVPHHAVDTYISRLIEKGEKVAICDQVEDPKLAKGLVKREVTRVVTPGTNMEIRPGDESANNYLLSIVCTSDRFGLAACDVATGEFLVTELESSSALRDEITKFHPAEILANEAFLCCGLDVEELREKRGILIETVDDRTIGDAYCQKLLLDHFHVATLEGLGLSGFSLAVNAAGALLSYLFETQKTDLAHITVIRPYRSGSYMLLDGATVRNLELIETLREKEKKGSLFWVLDRTKTAMGARKLRSFIEQPLLDKVRIERRLNAIETLLSHQITLEELREYLAPVYDLERLAARVSFRTANPRDLIALRNSMQMLPHIKNLLDELPAEAFVEFYNSFDALEDLANVLFAAIVDDPPLAMKEGGILRDGYDADVDEFRRARTEGKAWLAELEAREREKTGIHTLKVKYNRVFGYCIEVSKSFMNAVPDTYIRKQTLTNGERYTTPELKELEDKILGAEDKLQGLEYDIFCGIREDLRNQITRLQEAAKVVAEIDALCSLADAARRYNYVRPQITTDGVIEIRDGRHPVVERMLGNDLFVPNDTSLNTKKKRIAVITGPNMAGKSTYMRQTALIVLMAQIGSFVPAKSASIGLVDRIFTRVGASDDLASGQSTFMVEMTEVANILRSATSKSLLILDEIGRGTSTFDGLSIAWAVIEYIANKRILGSRTLFATHYHELTELEGKLEGINNYCIAVKEKEDGIVFLRKIIRGGADKSYGVQVARLAGVPEAVLARAEKLSAELSKADITSAIETLTGPSAKKEKPAPDEVDLSQMTFFDTARDEDILKDIVEMEITAMTPIEAMNELYRLQNKLKNRYRG